MNKNHPQARKMQHGNCAMFQSKMRFEGKSLAKAYLLTCHPNFQAKTLIHKCRFCAGYHLSTMKKDRAKVIDQRAKTRTTGLKYWRQFEALLKQAP